MGSVSKQMQVSSWSERVSAVVDGESCDGHSPAQLLEQFGAAERTVWAQYESIGDILRSDDLALEPGVSAGFMSRFSAALASEPHLLVPAVATAAQAERRAARVPLLRRVMPGAAISVAAATLTWIAVPHMHMAPGSAGGALQQVAFAPNGSQAGVIRDADLDQYLAAHEQFSQQQSLSRATPYLRTALATTDQ